MLDKKNFSCSPIVDLLMWFYRLCPKYIVRPLFQSQSFQFFALGAIILFLSPIHWAQLSRAGATPLIFASNQSRDFCPQALPQVVQQILQAPHLQRTRWGILIKPLSHPLKTGEKTKPFYDIHADQLFLPASTAKLFTTAAILTAFRPDYTFSTQLYGNGTPPKLESLRIKGQGDPTLTDSSLKMLALQLQQQGIREIETLIGDDRAFRGSGIIPSWEWEDLQTSDGVPINSLSVNQNALPVTLSPTRLGQSLKIDWPEGMLLEPMVIQNQTQTVSKESAEFIALERNLAGTQLTLSGQLREGAQANTAYVAIADPGLYFLKRFRAVLANHGIQVKALKLIEQDIPEFKPDPPENLLGAINSPALSRLIQVVNQESNNFYAESLLRSLGTLKAPSQVSKDKSNPEAEPDDSSVSQQSLAMLKQTLGTLGVDPTSYFLADGSGLSRQNLVSPESLVSTLIAMAQSPDATTFRNSLAIAGRAGSLKSRFLGTPAEGRVFAKTGTIKGTVTIAGYIDPPEHPPLVFSILSNHSEQSLPTLRASVDQIIVHLSQLKSCSP